MARAVSRRAAPQIPQYLLDQTVPRKVLQKRYMPHGKSLELDPFGYVVLEWFDPHTLSEGQTADVVIEFVPRARASVNPGPRVTVTNVKDQIAFHEAIGAPLPSNPPPRKKKPEDWRYLEPGVMPPADMARLIIAAHGREEGESKAIDLALSQKTIWWLEVVAAIKTAAPHVPPRQERLPNPARLREASALMSRPTPGEVASLMARMKLAWAECPWSRGRVRWDNLEAWLLEGDPEALAYVNTQLDPARCARARKQRLVERRGDEAEARYEAQGVNLEDIAHLGPMRLAARARGKNVWLYHGTTTKLWPSIRRHGLRIGDAKVDPQETPGVYLTAMPGRGIYTGGTASFYAERAAGVLGGRPVVLRVLVPFDDLTADTDDEDIQTGNYQFVTDYVGPQQILEVDGVRQPAPRQLTAAKAASRKGKKP